MWVLRDLSNGDGADGRPMPTYVWVFETRTAARSLLRLHRSDGQRYARLGTVEHWPMERLFRHYEDTGGGATGRYLRRRGRPSW